MTHYSKAIMAEKFAGKYSFVSQENFDEYLKDTGKISDSKNISSYSVTSGCMLVHLCIDMSLIFT